MLRLDQTGPVPSHQLLWDNALTARLNIIYHQRRVAHFEKLDRALRIVAAALASGGVTAAVKFVDSPGLVVLVGFVAAVVGVLSPILSYPERIKVSATLLPQYVKAHQTLARLYQSGKYEDADVKSALEMLDRIAIVEADKERAPDPSMLQQAQAALHRELGAPAPA